jgi:S-adenosylmethionine:tRNA-ribosyltransferase-isomerase (queuine synthetase)
MLYNNIINMSKEKYNPDVAKKYEQVTRDRDNINYEFSKQVYKGITNKFPENIKSPEDLKLHVDAPDFDSIKMKMEAAVKEREREKLDQERILKEMAEKKQNKKLVTVGKKTSDVIENHTDMKDSFKKFEINKNDNLVKEKLKMNDVLDFIKNL